MRVIVDLTRCQGYGQCVFLAPDVFTMHDEALLYDLQPADEHREHVLRAAAACPVQAIHLDRTALPLDLPSDQEVRPQLTDGRIVIVGASLAGARAAEVLRRDGFTGSLTMIGDETREPYDRPPLSKQVLTGQVPPEHTLLPRLREVEAELLFGTPATGLDVAGKRVHLADGRQVEFDRVLLATGTRARPWPDRAEAALAGVHTLRDARDAAELRQALAAGPRRVLILGAGFTGSEIASVCRELDLPVTVVERGPAPLYNAMGGVIGDVAARLHREHGVDLRTGTTVTALESDGNGRLSGARLSDGSTVEADVAVVALGSIRNVEWLRDSGLAAGAWGVTCDAGCRAVDLNGLVTDDVFVAGDIARFPHPLYEYQFMSLEHWGNAVAQAEIAAHNMVSDQAHRWPHLSVPVFWSSQFGVNIKSVGVPTFADQVVFAQGSPEERRFVAVYGYQGRITAAVTFDQAMWLEFYQRQIEQAAPFPPDFRHVAAGADGGPVPARVPERLVASAGATVVVTGHDPAERRATLVHPR
ncbi:FAD-dependent oxidoreductase [Nonomuraea gerenzanensis]|uniref:Ferredoxin reductase n=1 Tax=Nonomuraea gerenzanensis TaxID=93944 RepID=A0A1M4E7S6_9ACTN|nr:FAD-dependent oxidoreductase [Nonomuraea gerenzanensis]UBU17119.1 FAD-dependent oxidoreductase [Nonomuraea gerenzanensis]SBO94855.1 Ferredoxin reductase [Nonomuraea gerenzanensis]